MPTDGQPKTRALEHNHMNCWIIVGRFHGRFDFAWNIEINGVQHLGPIEPDGRDTIVGFVLNRFVTHKHVTEL